MLLGLQLLLAPESGGDPTIRCSSATIYQLGIGAQTGIAVYGHAQVAESNSIASHTAAYLKGQTQIAELLAIGAQAHIAIKSQTQVPSVPSLSAHTLERISSQAQGASTKTVSAHSIEAIKSVAVANYASSATNSNAHETLRGTTTTALSVGIASHVAERISSGITTTVATSYWAGVSKQLLRGAATLHDAASVSAQGSVYIKAASQSSYAHTLEAHARGSYIISCTGAVQYQEQASGNVQLAIGSTMAAVTDANLSAVTHYSLGSVAGAVYQHSVHALVAELIGGSASLSVVGVRFYARRSGYPLYAKLKASVLCTVQTTGYILIVKCVENENWLEIGTDPMRNVSVHKSKRAKVDAKANKRNGLKVKKARNHKVMTKPQVNRVVVER